jgi:hypothetical protein
MLDVVTHALGNRMKQVYDPLAVVEHTEGFQVPHAHRVVFPVFNRGESDRIHHPEQLTPADDAYYAKVVGELSLTDDMVRASLR